MATMVPPQKGVEYIFYVGLVSQADTKLLQNNPTLAAGDVLVSTDGGATSNLDTLPAVTPASSDIVKVTVSASEMNGDNIIIVFSDAAGSEWCDLLINIQTSAQSLDTTDSAVDAIPTTAMRGTDNAALASSWTAALATALGNYNATRAGYLDELAAANLPTDVAANATAIAALENLSQAEAQVAANAALVALHLDHILAVAYDPASKPGAADALLNELVEDDSGVSRFTTNALEQAPSGTGGDATAANQTTIINALTTAQADLDDPDQYKAGKSVEL